MEIPLIPAIIGPYYKGYEAISRQETIENGTYFNPDYEKVVVQEQIDPKTEQTTWFVLHFRKEQPNWDHIWT